MKLKLARKIGLILFFSIFMLIASVVAEPFRVHELVPVTLSDDQTTEQVINVGINDSIAIFLPNELVYCEGVELQMQIPDAVAQWRDSVVCSIYENISPRPAAEKIDYSGTRAFIATLPMRTSWAIQIPFKADNSIKETGFAQKIDLVPNISEHFVFVRIQPAMKGIPDETLNARIKITVKPLLLNKGKLVLDVNAPENKPFTVLVDDTQMPETFDGMIEPGQHTVSIVSENYRNETRTVRVDQAKTTSLSVTMRSIEPTLFVSAPENAEVFLDDEIFSDVGHEIAVTEGDHKIRFKTASYEVTKEIFVQNGKTYTVSLVLDINVIEE